MGVFKVSGGSGAGNEALRIDGVGRKKQPGLPGKPHTTASIYQGKSRHSFAPEQHRNHHTSRTSNKPPDIITSALETPTIYLKQPSFFLLCCAV